MTPSNLATIKRLAEQGDPFFAGVLHGLRLAEKARPPVDPSPFDRRDRYPDYATAHTTGAWRTVN